jgi:RIO kinase 1
MVINRSREEWKTYANVFDSFTLRNIERLASQGYFEELESAIALGKEANVFSAKTVDDTYVVVKIFRLENCNFNKMYEYISQDNRYLDLKGQKRRLIFAWTQREYRNLLKAREYIRVPTPLLFRDNIIIMEYINQENRPAPKLKDADISNPEKTFDEIKEMIYLLLSKAELVHGDLSEFNILMQNESPVFIDISQGTPADSPLAPTLLKRDITVLCRFFKRLGYFYDPELIYQELIDRLKKETKLLKTA